MPKAFLEYSLGYWKVQPTLLGKASELEARGAEPSVTFHDFTFRSNTGDLIDVLGVSVARPAPAPLSSLHPAPQQPHRAVHILNMQPSSNDTDPATCWTPQPQGPSPAKRHCLHDSQAPSHLEEPSVSTSYASTSMVFLAADCVLQLQLDGVELLLEPDANSVLEVELPEHTIILVPEGLQAPDHLGQPGFLSATPQGGAVLEMPADDLLVLQPGSSCEFILESSYQEESYDEDEDSGSLSPWMDPPAGQASEHFSSTIRMPSPWPQGHIPEPYPSGSSPNAEPYSPRSVWDQDSYLLGPFPSSPLQPLPPSPPPSPQEQRPPSSPRSPCKARKRLFCE
ncbi:proline-rich protein 23A3-like [Chionomys nivalis]|uniref:proline-rich protein 23A3-like n=1 Tax=Chionomys nivalis TaxID=269649 RepID=UPI002598D857|nr:proline-rich protein 23A3-like [Chionomys nivalis]